MLNVIASSLMIASRTPGKPQEKDPSSPAENESARARRSREIAAFLEAARRSDHEHINA